MAGDLPDRFPGEGVQRFHGLVVLDGHGAEGGKIDLLGEGFCARGERCEDSRQAE